MAVRYPEVVEYHEAVQNPSRAFRDPELQRGQIEVNRLGLPVALSGGFALTYMMRAARRKLALRCFLREIPAAQQKYAAIAGACRALKSRYFVDFEYLGDGIVLHGQAYPVVKMDWAEGDTLGVWLERHHADRRALAGLREAFVGLADYLEMNGIAHGDIQNGNVIVSSGGLKLVDYDGVYVPGMPADFACETGHRHFQHPLRTTAHFGPRIDRFSFIVTDLSLAALIEDPSLYQRFCTGGEAIILHAEDFAAPDKSKLLRRLLELPDLAPSARDFAAICRGDIRAVPTLADYRAGRNIPTKAAPRPAPPKRADGTTNRQLVARLLGDGMGSPAGAAPPPAPLASPVPASNRSVVQRMRDLAPQPPLLRPDATPQPSATPAPNSAGARSAHSPVGQIPRAGSFIIHPRMPSPSRAAPHLPTKQTGAPGLWGRVMRLFGVD